MESDVHGTSNPVGLSGNMDRILEYFVNSST